MSHAIQSNAYRRAAAGFMVLFVNNCHKFPKTNSKTCLLNHGILQRTLLPQQKRTALYEYSTVSDHGPWRILFYGTDAFSLKALKALNENRLGKSSPIIVKHLEVVCVKKIVSLVERYARENNLPVHKWPFQVPEGHFDIGVVSSFGHLIPEDSIKACRFGMLNIHGSLLPRWRGAAPVIHTILNGDKVAGVTIMEIAPKKFDIGKIVLQQECDIGPHETSENLFKVLGDMGSKLLMVCLKDLRNYLEKSKPQPSEGVTHAPKVKPEMGEINWRTQTVQEIDCLYRALTGVMPIYTDWHGVKMKLFNMIPPDDEIIRDIDDSVSENMKPGSCHFHKSRKTLCVRCKDGWVAFEAVGLAGHKRMKAQDFYNGFLSKVPHDQWFLGT